MGSHAYHGANLENTSLPPILILAVLAGVDTFVVCLATAPWLFEDIHSPRVLLAPIVNGPLIALLLAVEITLWNRLRSRSRQWESEADAAFASITRTPRDATVREPILDPAVILIRKNPGRLAQLGYFVVYVDDQPWMIVLRQPLVQVLVPAGRHRVHIRAGWFTSEEVAVDLTGGEQLELICGARILKRSKLFRFFELKMWFVATPVAIAAFYLPAVTRIIELHFAAEFLAIIFVAQLGFLISLPRYFSRKPGAMIYLMEGAAHCDAHCCLGLRVEI